MTDRESISRLQYAYSNAKSSWQTTTGEESWESDREVDGARRGMWMWLAITITTSNSSHIVGDICGQAPSTPFSS